MHWRLACSCVMTPVFCSARQLWHVLCCAPVWAVWVWPFAGQAPLLLLRLHSQCMWCVTAHHSSCWHAMCGAQVFERSSFAPLEGSYLSTWLHSGQRVELEEAASGQLGRDAGASGGRVALTIQGLSRSGFLLATDEWGAQFELTPDGNSLDMMQGLIRRKLQ